MTHVARICLHGLSFMVGGAAGAYAMVLWHQQWLITHCHVVPLIGGWYCQP